MQKRTDKMKYLIENEALELKHRPGMGAWTYHIEVPNTKQIKGKWGNVKVSGFINGYKIESMNLAPVKNGDRMLSINGAIRTAIQKQGGEMLNVTLWLLTPTDKLNELQIREALREAAVLSRFELLSADKQLQMLNNIVSLSSDNLQIKAIVKLINQLSEK